MVAQAHTDGMQPIDPREELRRQRRLLADAWWYERPLEEIERIEQRIRELTGQLRGTEASTRPQPVPTHRHTGPSTAGESRLGTHNHGAGRVGVPHARPASLPSKN